MRIPGIRPRRALASLALAATSAACNGPFLLFPGGALQGTPQPTPDSWDFTDEIGTVQIETRPEDPYSVNIWVTASDGHLYLHAGASHSTWVEHLEEDPRLRLRADESIYELAAVRVETQEEFDRFTEAYDAKYGVRPRNENVDEVYLFRLSARQAGGGSPASVGAHASRPVKRLTRGSGRRAP